MGRTIRRGSCFSICDFDASFKFVAVLGFSLVVSFVTTGVVAPGFMVDGTFVDLWVPSVEIGDLVVILCVDGTLDDLIIVVEGFMVTVVSFVEELVV